MKVAIYCRLSQEDRNKVHETDDSESIQNQKSMLLDYIQRQEEWELYDIYSDDDYTGSDRNRPAFNRLLTDAKERRFDIILCKTQSRFTRELELVEKYIHGLFPLWGIRFVSIVDNADTDNKGNKKSRQINGLVNEWYLENMSDNIKSVLLNRRMNGYHVGSFALYGYQKDPQAKGHLIIDEEAAGVVREIFALYAQGYGKTTIARMLNDRGIPNPSEYKHQCGLHYRHAMQLGSYWRYHTIGYILTNEFYIGNMVQGKSSSISYKTKKQKPLPKSEWCVVEGTHEPIIDRELWDRVQKMGAERAKPFGDGKIGVFTGKVRCAHCGYTMNKSNARTHQYLRCALHREAKQACVGSTIAIDKLEEVVIQEIRKLAGEYLDKDEAAKKVEFCNHLQEQKTRILSDISLYKNKIEEYTKGIRELYMDKVRGILAESDYVDMVKHFTDERSRLGLAVEDGERQLSEIDTKIAMGDNRRELVERYVNLDHLTRDIVDTLIDYISVDSVPRSKDVTVEIHWKF